MIQNSFIGKVLKSIGMDRAIAFGSGARVVQAVSGVVTIFFIATFLTGAEQGYYYTFGSLIAIQTFFELGFTNIITQFVAHEVSHLQITKENSFEGEQLYQSRLSSLLHFSLKWYTIASLLFFVIVFLIGLYFFNNNVDPTENVDWQIPWIIICTATAVKMFQSPFTAILTGLNKVVEMNEIMFIQQVITPLVMWILLITHCGLYVVGVSSVVAVLVWFFYIIKKGDLKELLINIYKIPVKENVDYMKEIFPYQWRIAISSLSGYFIFYFLTPIIFKYQGAVISGQVGMAISIISAIQSFSMSWLNTKVPLYSQLIARKEYTELDTIFNKTMKQMIIVCVFLMVCAFIFLSGLDWFKVTYNGELLSDRCLKGWPLLFLMLGYITDQFSFSWATYLRCHKKEPFMTISLITGVLCLAVIYVSAKYSTIFYVILLYALTRILMTPWGYYIYRDNKIKWHKQ